MTAEHAVRVTKRARSWLPSATYFATYFTAPAPRPMLPTLAAVAAAATIAHTPKSPMPTSLTTNP